MTRYSVVIPTRSRSGTLRHVLRNVLSAARDDIEVIVHQCGPDAATDAVIAEVADRRLRYVASDDVVPMRDNWERAVALATGDFVTVLGDDDGLMPDAFAVADDLIAHHALSILSWRPVTWYWPGYFDARLAGRAVYRYDIAAGNIRFASKHALRSLYRFRWSYADMPMIYNSFVARRLIDTVRARHGRYFLQTSPDIASGVVNAMHCDDFVWSNYPLGITGVSASSTGHRMSMQADPRLREQALADFRPEAPDRSWIPGTTNLDCSIAAELLAMRRDLGLDPVGIPVRMDDVAEHVAHGMPRFTNHEASRADLQALCARHGIDFDRLARRYRLEPRTGEPPAETISETEVVLARDLAADGATDIASAALAIAAQLGGRRRVPTTAVGFGFARVRLGDGPVTLRFCRNGNAPQTLAEGWNDAEDFGAWSRDEEARIALPAIEWPAGATHLRLAIACRGLITAAKSRVPFTIAAAGVTHAGTWTARAPAALVTLDIDRAAIAPDAPFEIVVTCGRLANPALVADSSDNRCLGFGIETITITPLTGAQAPRGTAATTRPRP